MARPPLLCKEGNALSLTIGTITQSHPVPGLKEFQSLRFHRSWLRPEVVNPPHKRRQAHENRLCSSTRFQSKDRPTIIEEVKFDVPSAPVELIFTFSVSVRHVPPPFCDRQVRFEERVAHVTNKREVLLGIALDIIKKMPPMPRISPRCFSMKYSSHPFLKRG